MRPRGMLGLLALPGRLWTWGLAPWTDYQILRLPRSPSGRVRRWRWRRRSGTPEAAVMEVSPEPGPERLFDSHRLPGDGFLLLALLLYAPVGFCLLILRLFLGIHVFLVSCALPDSVLRRFVVRTMCAVLGLVARQENSGLRDHRVRVLISNHVTPFDHNIVNLLTTCSTPLLNSPPSFVCWSRGFMEMDGQGELVESLKRFCASTRLPPTPLLLFPEEEATNGREGLLHFSSWPFSIQDVVQPLTLQVQRPLVSVTVSDASWVSELLWSLFVPFTVYQVRWLRPVHRQLGEGNEEFALRVQQLVAKELGQTGTRLTPADKAEHMKRQRHPRIRPQSAQSSLPPSPGPSPDVQLATLAQRVKEVLPHVPLGVIQRDLARTGCVDLTITNLLEGAVAFMPEDITEGTQSLPTATTPKFPSSGLVTSQPTALTFAKSSWARQESLQERKQALYEYARRRFTEKQAQEAD
ncbi:lipid droplet-regulating VLDL assembly factor AUP1 isoform X3 [Nycticebus coucang]|uniref:lipid droplet-regulating VLDL assembly factor AUP1 isoform X3 n=1 Tax=Nycticebus coucang TaxID=9470 RepID=UPI00234CDD23|nr:lipid droplet-regulating VLDL assembly factor AUP1 isoform X3 [Nycticebus coucang]